MLKNYFITAIRSLRSNKFFSLVNILGLSIGIAAALVIFLVAQYDFSFDTHHKDGARIYRVVTDFSSGGDVGHNSGVTGPVAEAIKTGIPGLEQSAPFFLMWGMPDVNVSSAVFRHQGGIVLADQRYFQLFEYKWLAGSPVSALAEPYRVVLTSGQASLYFPTLPYDQVLGRTILYDDSIKTTVSGIVETPKNNTDFSFHDFISYVTGNTYQPLKQDMDLERWGSTTPASQLFIKIGDHTSPENVENQINGLLAKNRPEISTVRGEQGKGHFNRLSLQPLSDLHFNADYGGFEDSRVANKNTLYGLLTIAAFLLLLGCINFINLTTAGASRRAKEIGIRKTIGSTRGQLIGQFLSETFLITAMGSLLSLALAPLILHLFAGFIPPGVSAALLLSPNILLFLGLLTIAVTFFSGFYPALLLSGYKPLVVLKNQVATGSGQTRNAWLRKSLTVSQLVIAQFFIMATLLVSKQIYYALHKDLGYQKEAIVYIQTPWQQKYAERKQLLINKLTALSAVERVSLGGASPASDNTHSSGARYNNGKEEVETTVQERFGDENYIQVYHIRLLAGHNLPHNPTNDQGKNLLINANYAKVLGFKDPSEAVGRILTYGGRQMEIAGVVADFYYRSLHSPIQPMVIVPGRNAYFTGTLHIALKPGTAGGNEWKQAIAGMAKAWKEVYPEEDFDYHFFDESIAQLYENERRVSTLLGWAMGLSIFISCLGLLGLTVHTTQQRTREIGVRKVLGATVMQVMVLLSRDLVLLVVLAFVLVTPIAWWALHAWMADFADRTPISWWIFAGSGIGMLLVAIITLSLQTAKAATSNPVSALRSE